MKTVIAICLAATAVAIAAALAAAQNPTSVSRQLAAAKAATLKYRSVAAAIADGYVRPPGPLTATCVSEPNGKAAAMGVHFENPALTRDPALSITKPEILVYAPTAHGLQLAAVEYFRADSDQNLKTAGDRPSLFGQRFQGPMPGHVAGMPIHYDLHVWLFKHNPNGTFAQWNLNVSCPHS